MPVWDVFIDWSTIPLPCWAIEALDGPWGHRQALSQARVTPERPLQIEVWPRPDECNLTKGRLQGNSTRPASRAGTPTDWLGRRRVPWIRQVRVKALHHSANDTAHKHSVSPKKARQIRTSIVAKNCITDKFGKNCV